MIELRALRNTAINVYMGEEKGMCLRFVKGPEEQEDGSHKPGEIVEVDDLFVVNPDVWEVVRRSPDGRDVVVLPHPARGVSYVVPRSQQVATGPNTVGNVGGGVESIEMMAALAELAELRRSELDSLAKERAELLAMKEQLNALLAAQGQPKATTAAPAKKG